MESIEKSAEKNREGEVIEPFDLKDGRKAVLRFAKKDDAEGLALAAEDRREFRFKEYRKPKKENQRSEVINNLERSLEKPEELCFIVADSGGDIAGYVEFGPEPDWGEYTVRVYTLSVKEKYHKQGFGRELLKKCVEKAEEIYGAKRIALNTHVWNKPALRLYKSENFKSEGNFEPEKNNDGTFRMAFDPTIGKKGRMVISEKIRMIKDFGK